MGVLRRGWLRAFVGGLVLPFLLERALVATSNPNFFPNLHERLAGWEVPLPALAVCFLWGGEAER